MSLPFDLTEGAVADLKELVASLTRQSQRAALSLVDDLERTFHFLGSWPHAGHRNRQVTDQEDIRFWPAHGYSIVYDAAKSPIRILCVLHGARDLASVLNSRLDQR